jgi:hypothetical protein
MARVPTHFQQTFRSGDACSGVAFTGTATPDFSNNFLYKQAPAVGDGAIDGGLIPISTNMLTGYQYSLRKLEGAYIYADDATSIAVKIVEPVSGTEITLVSVASDTLVIPMNQDEYMIPDGWRIKVVTNAAPIGVNGGFIYLALDTWVIYPN